MADSDPLELDDTGNEADVEDSVVDIDDSVVDIDDNEADLEDSVDGIEADEAEVEVTPLMDLTVDVKELSACQRHLTVTIARDTIDRYYDKEFSEIVESAQVPGFRVGRAPRKLVEARFRKDVGEKIKSELLMDGMAQVSDQQELSPIGEPDLDIEAVELPDTGPMIFEFDLEVRPNFDLPDWQGLDIEKPVRKFSDQDVDQALERLLADYGQLVPFDGPATSGDYVTCNLTFKDGDTVVASAEEEVIRIRPELSFRDGSIQEFDKLLEGVRAEETREGEAQLTHDAPNVAMRGKAIRAIFEVLEVKKLDLPELTPDFLAELGDFESEAVLRDAVRDNLERQLVYHQHQRAREQIAAALTVSADWELPPDLLQRQSARELERAILELRRSGFSDAEINAHENQLRQNSAVSTAQALKEHFILERIAEEKEIEVHAIDYDFEIALIAQQSNQSTRRVRAQLEKSGGMDVLHNQIIERKVIDRILVEATFKETHFEPEVSQTEAIDRAAGGGESKIPEAQPEKGPSGQAPYKEEPSRSHPT